MGIFTSYCKDCNNKIDWFLPPKYGFIQCRKCDEYNTYDDLSNSLRNKNYWNIRRRKKKINKLLNKG
jgi:hypothetical protein